MNIHNLCRTAALLSVLLLTVGGTMSACGGETVDTPVSGSVSDETAPAETEAPDKYDLLKTRDYGGYEFRVMTTYSNYAFTDFDVDAATGDILEDTVYKRNRAVEEKMNITIVNTKGQGYNDVDDRLRLDAAAGDDSFDLMFSEAGISVQSASNGSMLNLLSIPDIDFSNSWWEQNTLKDYKINGELYFTHSPMHLHYYESLVAILFNKHVAEEYQLDDMQTLAAAGSFTIDAMNEAARKCTQDMNGDGKMNAAEDLFGSAISTNLLPYFVLGADCRFTEMEDGRIVYHGVSDRLASFTEKLTGIVAKNGYIGYTTPGVETYADGYVGAFLSNHALFYVDVLGHVKDMRKMDADFGILPLPKFDEAQESYLSTNYCGAAILFVPVTDAHAEEIGPILEMLGAYSERDLLPAYYEVNIMTKGLRDEASAEMLHLMLDNITFDLSLVFQLNNINYLYETTVIQNKPIVSAFEKEEKRLQKSIDTMMGAFYSDGQ